MTQETSMRRNQSQSPRPGGRWPRRTLALAAVLLGALVAALAAALPAQAFLQDPAAEFGIHTFETRSIGPKDAGGHPTVQTKIRFKTFDRSEPWGPVLVPYGTPQRIEVDMPFGLVGDPRAMPRCTREQFRAQRCPPQTQIGLSAPYPTGLMIFENRPIYNLEPDGTSPALFGIDVLGVIGNVAYLRVFVRGDGGLRTVTDPLPRTTPLIENTLTFWGVPADENFCNPNRPGFDPAAPSPYDLNGGPCPTSDPAAWERRAFMTAPTDCRIVPTSTLRVFSYEGRSATASRQQEHAPEHCEGLTFDPSVSIAPSTAAAGAPTGLNVNIDVPQRTDPDGRATPRIQDVKVTLPEGMAINPSAAQGLQGCPADAFARGVEAPGRCSPESKIGTVTITSPLIDQPLQGAIYIAAQTPQHIFRTFIEAEGQGVRIKLTGVIDRDPATGRIVATFRDNPPLPFSRFSLSFKDGPRAPLVNPIGCGTYTSVAEVTGYSGQVVQSPSSFAVDGSGSVPCAPRGFSPGFQAGTTSTVAGADTSFSLTFSRGDADQLLQAIDTHLPAGVTGRIASVPVLCGDAQAASGTCDPSTRIGSVRSGAGAGSNPLFLPGGAFLTGPYKGGPFGLSIVVPAVAGPFDLGTVVVRAAIHVDRRTAALRVVSDPLPTILEGVPLQIRSVNVTVDRPKFMVNPTSCSVKQVLARLSSTQGATADARARFQVGSCARLPLAPKMTLAVGARGRLRTGMTTPFTATLTQTAGQANLRHVRVVLPKAINARLPVVRRACTLEQFQSDRCSKDVLVGTGTATTPLLRDPLTGPAYFVRNGGRLPDLMVKLRGQVEIDLAGKVTIPRDLTLRTDFDAVPDVPISKFQLRLVAGRNGPLGIVDNLCQARARRQRARLTFRAHSGRVTQVQQRLRVNGCR